MTGHRQVLGFVKLTSFTGQYYFTIDYTGSEIADDPAQHKQSHLLQLTDGPWKGCIVALPTTGKGNVASYVGHG